MQGGTLARVMARVEEGNMMFLSKESLKHSVS